MDVSQQYAPTTLPPPPLPEKELRIRSRRRGEDESFASAGIQTPDCPACRGVAKQTFPDISEFRLKSDSKKLLLWRPTGISKRISRLKSLNRYI
jgi:hypothetical protein